MNEQIPIRQKILVKMDRWVPLLSGNTMIPVEEQVFDDYRRQPGHDALRRLLELYQDRIYNLCYQVLRHSQDAEDASQQVLIKLVEGLRTIPDAGQLRRWIGRVALNKALDMKREEARRFLRERQATPTSPSDPEAPEAREAIQRALTSLDETLRFLILEHYFERRTLEEIAHREGCSAVAVWKKLDKGKKGLERSLRQAGFASFIPIIDPYLGSIVPVQAPTGLVSEAVLEKLALAGTAAGPILVTGGMTMASKSFVSMTTIVVATLGIGFGMVGGHLLSSTARGAEEERARELEHKLAASAKSLESSRQEATRWRAKAEASSPASPEEVARLRAENERLRQELASRSGSVDMPRKPSLDKVLQEFVALISAKGYPAMMDQSFAQLAKTFGECGAEAPKKLAEMLLTGRTPEERGLSAHMLEALKSLEGTSALERALLDDKDDMVRRFSSHALAMIRDEKAVPALLEAMKNDADFGVRLNSAYGLAKGGNEEAIRWLMTYCDEPDKREYRLIVYPALADVAHPMTAPLFRKLLEEPAELSVVTSAIQALEKMKDREALPALTRLIQGNSSQSIKAAAEKAFATISNQ